MPPWLALPLLGLALKPLLASEHDHLVSVECTLTLARNWQCAVRIHPSAGHDLPLDDGLWVVAQVQQWVEPKEKNDLAM